MGGPKGRLRTPIALGSIVARAIGLLQTQLRKKIIVMMANVTPRTGIEYLNM
jgi:hypothetical protein